MSEITIRKVGNGYVVKSHELHEPEQEMIATTDKDMIDLVTEFFFGGVLDLPEVVWSQDLMPTVPEQPSEESTETMIDDSDPVPASLPVEPMADLSATQVHKDDPRAFMRLNFLEADLRDGVSAEAVSANGEKVSITE